MQRPDKSEYHPYYSMYVDLVPEGDVVKILNDQIQETLGALADVDEERALYRYAPDKWSVKEVVGHMIDTERIFSFRALAFARNDAAPIPGMEQDDYVANAKFEGRPWQTFVDEFRHLRAANVALLGSLDDELSLRKGVASEREFSVRATAYIIAGHELHHRQVLRERY